ncbi:VOC family protein [Stenotrophomonas mori]|uniref:VOC family protein n=1 Tax=Stenotrophomonas mori TaxID=2871096 RepID=A0ABT0SCV7_9GAMM|nr:VOC family protein [Stenotrophomonas mori]MCL7713127.1 VOC family protein [Stenotrophomonas mori]
MKVNRIVANIRTDDLEAADAFYHGILGLERAMDHGWFRTYAADARMRVQLGVALEGETGPPQPDLSVEVDDLDEALERVRRAGVVITYGPVHEPWGVRRFFVRDPFGTLLNILQHDAADTAG